MVAQSLRADRVERRAAIDDLRAALERRDAVSPAAAGAVSSGRTSCRVCAPDTASGHPPGLG